MVAAVLASPLLRRRFNRWGATDDELTSQMPGDELVPQPKLGYTRAITIDAPPTTVWPWLVQIGQGRGGLYSYDALENLVGCNIHSTDQILDEHQQLGVGDIIRSGPDNFPCWMVMAIKPTEHLVLLGAGTPADMSVPDTPPDVIPPKDDAAATWQWQLRPHANQTQNPPHRAATPHLQPRPGRHLATRRTHQLRDGTQNAQRPQDTGRKPSLSKGLRKTPVASAEF